MLVAYLLLVHGQRNGLGRVVSARRLGIVRAALLLLQGRPVVHILLTFRVGSHATGCAMLACVPSSRGAAGCVCQSLRRRRSASRGPERLQHYRPACLVSLVSAWTKLADSASQPMHFWASASSPQSTPSPRAALIGMRSTASNRSLLQSHALPRMRAQSGAENSVSDFGEFNSEARCFRAHHMRTRQQGKEKLPRRRSSRCLPARASPPIDTVLNRPAPSFVARDKVRAGRCHGI